MAGQTLNDRFFETSRGRVIRLLRRNASTVEELATSLELSDNAVRSHLATLERDGLVRTQGVRRGPGAGKPATLYEIHPEAAPTFFRGYAPLLIALLDELAERAPAALDPEAMRAVGLRIARALGFPAGAGAEAGVEAVLSVLVDLGLDPAAEHEAGRVHIRNCAPCPLSEAVRAHPGLCRAFESLLIEASATEVRSVCDHGETPRCAFEMAAATLQEERTR